jgi:BASS family bile acid:Na+ symporter
MRSLFLFGAIALGGLLPQGHHYAFLIRHLLMVILFLSLLDLKLDRKIALSPRLGTIVAMMMALSGLAAWIGHWFSPELALVGFLLAMAPTAAAAPVMTDFLEGRVDYVMASVVMTSVFSAIAVPLALPLLSPDSAVSLDLSALGATLTVVLNSLSHRPRAPAAVAPGGDHPAAAEKSVLLCVDVGHLPGHGSGHLLH